MNHPLRKGTLTRYRLTPYLFTVVWVLFFLIYAVEAFLTWIWDAGFAFLVAAGAVVVLNWQLRTIELMRVLERDGHTLNQITDVRRIREPK